MATLAAQIETDFTTLNRSATAREILVTVANATQLTLACTHVAAKVQEYYGDVDGTNKAAVMDGVNRLLIYLKEELQAKFSPAGEAMLKNARDSLVHAQKAANQKANIPVSGARADDTSLNRSNINTRYNRTTS